MIITYAWLVEHEACPPALLQFRRNFGKYGDTVDILNLLKQKREYDWAEWLVLEILDDHDKFLKNKINLIKSDSKLKDHFQRHDGLKSFLNIHNSDWCPAEVMEFLNMTRTDIAFWQGDAVI